MNGGATTLASSFRALRRNLRAGARLALFLRVSREDFAVEPGHFAALAGFNLLIWLAAGYARAGFAGSLNPTALTGYLAALPLVMLAALVAAGLYRRREQMAALMVAFISADWLFEIVNLALFRASPAGVAHLVLGTGFITWVFATALRAVWVCGGSERRPFAGAGAFVLLLFALLLYVFPQAEPWVQPGELAPRPALAEERLFHRQGELIERELAAIAPGRPGVPELYFVGFAPDGSQDVFLREMRYVRKLFDQRYATRGRSALLASGEEALDEHPIATLTNLRRVLRRVGDAMNDDEDVLFLFVSGHGGRDHQLSAWQPGIEAGPVNPTALARALQDSGIRSRLVVISACYSGGFIEALRNDETLVITAAASDRTSFGCAHGNDFTYFGGAFFRDALARTRSFAEAFTIASDLVTRQETAEKLLPSRPQLWQGGAIGARLRAVEGGAR